MTVYKVASKLLLILSFRWKLYKLFSWWWCCQKLWVCFSNDKL